MSDDISIPSAGGARTAYTHSYRSRRSAGVDPGTRLLILAASGIGLVLAGGMAVWSLSGHHASGTSVPTIAADTRPLRIKPEDPGGMSVSAFGDVPASANTASDLAPAAERPDPQALLAQRQAGAAPPISTGPLPALASAAAPAVLPTPTQAVMAAAPVTALPVTARPATAGILVQLAAVSSEAGANVEWQRLSHRLPELLGGRQLVTQRAELAATQGAATQGAATQGATTQGAKPVWRVRTGGFADVADATQFCRRVRDKGVGCTLASF